MQIVRSHHGVPIRLTPERWSHIVANHPEMVGQEGQMLETVELPEMLQEGDFGELLAVRHYATTPLTSKFLIVVFKEVAPNDGFILTTYYASRLSMRRKILWKR